jgi:hypothetical protein
LCLLERAGPPEVDAERIDAILAVDESKRLGEIKSPVVVIGAKNDAVCPPYYSEQLSAAIRVRLRMSWMSDPAEEQISHSEEDHGFGDVEALLVIADQPALCIAPVWPSQPRQPVFSTRLLLCSRKRRDTWIPVALTAGHQRPHYARRLVCERDGGELRRRACQQLHEPRPAGAVALGVPDHRHGTDDQHLAQIPIACLGDAAQAHLVARGVRGSHLAVTLRFLLPGQRRMVTRR